MSGVSVVIACYNKEQYIARLLDSILAQTTGVKEVILVNDGSTDATMDVVRPYGQKFEKAGTDLILIEQENQGVAAAVRNGLGHVSGEFVCMPDADDAYASRFVERMTACLKEDQEAQWVVCDSDRTRWTHCYDEYTDKKCGTDRFEDLMDRYMLMCNCGMAWQLMIRTSYLKKVRIADALGLLGWTTTHEAPVWMPLIHGGGQGIYLPEGLYYFTDSVGSLSNPGDVEKTLAYARRYRESIERMLEFLEIREERYFFLARLREYMEIVAHAPQLKEYVGRTLSDLLMHCGYITEPFRPEALYCVGRDPGYRFYYWMWLGFVPQFRNDPEGEVIAYGALGKRAEHAIPQWNQTSWKPTQLWDRNGGDTVVSKPRFDTLKEGDVILVFPKDEMIAAEIRNAVKDTGVRVLHGMEMQQVFRKQYAEGFPGWRRAGVYHISGWNG